MATPDLATTPMALVMVATVGTTATILMEVTAGTMDTMVTTLTAAVTMHTTMAIGPEAIAMKEAVPSQDTRELPS